MTRDQEEIPLGDLVRRLGDVHNAILRNGADVRMVKPIQYSIYWERRWICYRRSRNKEKMHWSVIRIWHIREVDCISLYHWLMKGLPYFLRLEKKSHLRITGNHSVMGNNGIGHICLHTQFPSSEGLLLLTAFCNKHIMFITKCCFTLYKSTTVNKPKSGPFCWLSPTFTNFFSNNLDEL